MAKSDGSTASYYELPKDATELQHLIAYRNMNAQMGEIFRANYRYGECDHSDKLREINKIIFYAQAEKERLLKYGCGDKESAAVRTLEKLGYTHNGGELWKPPLGAPPELIKEQKTEEPPLCTRCLKPIVGRAYYCGNELRCEKHS